MRGNELLDKMELIDPAYVEAAETKPKGKKNIWIKWGAMTACLCMVVIGVMFWKQSEPTPSDAAGPTVSENGVTIPQLKVSLSVNEAADMVAFFIYQGRCYVQYEWIYDNVDFIGEYLGTATGLINEWTSQDGYVELAGSISGDFYVVNGYDPSFMLCMKDETGAVATYICNNGITLKYGSELYEDRLHLSGSIESVQYESRDSWYASRGELYQMNSINDTVLDFIAGMDSGLFIPYDAVPLNGKAYISETELYHLYFRMKNGTTVHLRLHENGYVRFDGMWALCIQVPEENYNAMLNLMDNHTDSSE